MTKPYFTGGRVIEGNKPGNNPGLFRRVVVSFFAVMHPKDWYCVCVLTGGVFFLEFLRRESKRKGALSFGPEWLFLFGGLALGLAALLLAKKLNKSAK
jgi:hypothetical protein